VLILIQLQQNFSRPFPFSVFCFRSVSRAELQPPGNSGSWPTEPFNWAVRHRARADLLLALFFSKSVPVSVRDLIGCSDFCRALRDKIPFIILLFF
jgi:hypothetical protein